MSANRFSFCGAPTEALHLDPSGGFRPPELLGYNPQMKIPGAAIVYDRIVVLSDCEVTCLPCEFLC